MRNNTSPAFTRLIVDDIDFDYAPSNFRCHAHHEGLNGRLRRVRRHAVGDDRIEEQDHDQAENDEGPAPDRVTRRLRLVGRSRHGSTRYPTFRHYAESGQFPKNLGWPRRSTTSRGSYSRLSCREPVTQYADEQEQKKLRHQGEIDDREIH